MLLKAFSSKVDSDLVPFNPMARENSAADAVLGKRPHQRITDVTQHWI